jgi:PTS system ascorbate-specific IIA component
MAGILIIAHAPLATALKDCVAHIYGGVPARIGVIDVLPDCDPVQMIALAQTEIERLREENGALVLTDVYGATPANIACRLAGLQGVRVLAGVNLPMLVRAVCYRSVPLDQLVDKALAGAANGIRAIGPQTTPGEAATPPACVSAIASAAGAGGAMPAAETALGPVQADDGLRRS